MRNFLLVRDEDVSGISGTGAVAEGTLFTSGKAVLSWFKKPISSIVIYDSMDELISIHGHGGRTRVSWLPSQEDIEDSMVEEESGTCMNCVGCHCECL